MTLLETEHQDLIHDAQMDYYGRKLATCSSDRTIRLFSIIGNEQKPLDTLIGHEGPVWQVSWAHPKFGNILASCSYDSKVIIWREGSVTTGSQKWVKIKEYTGHSASVNSVSWAPHEYGLELAAGASDGKISILTWKSIFICLKKDDGTWDVDGFDAHTLGVNSVSWCPSTVPGSLVQLGAPVSPISNVKRLVTGGCDHLVKIWWYLGTHLTYSQADNGSWVEEAVLEGHTDWVRDVAWAPNIGITASYIASGSQDKTVIIWVQNAPGGTWEKKKLGDNYTFPDVVWRVSWSVSGALLAVSSGDNQVSLWKENLDGVFEQVGDVAQQ